MVLGPGCQGRDPGSKVKLAGWNPHPVFETISW
jgi:hypothetical protein